MELPFASQDPLVRFWAILSGALLGILAVLAGAALMFEQKMVAAYDMEPSTALLSGGRLGLGGIAAAWIGYMGVLVFLLGYARSGNRALLVAIIFAATAFYLFCVLVSSLVPFNCITTSVM